MPRFFCAFLLLATTFVTLAQDPVPATITIRAGRLLDGRGGSQQNVDVRVEAGRIVSVGQSSRPVTHDRSRLTLLPGFIDTHVHIRWHFNEDGRFDTRGETPEDRIQAGIVNARETVHRFTTVQSLGR